MPKDWWGELEVVGACKHKPSSEQMFQVCGVRANCIHQNIRISFLFPFVTQNTNSPYGRFRFHDLPKQNRNDLFIAQNPVSTCAFSGFFGASFVVLRERMDQRSSLMLHSVRKSVHLSFELQRQDFPRG